MAVAPLKPHQRQSSGLLNATLNFPVKIFNFGVLRISSGSNIGHEFGGFLKLV